MNARSRKPGGQAPASKSAGAPSPAPALGPDATPDIWEELVACRRRGEASATSQVSVPRVGSSAAKRGPCPDSNVFL